MPEKAIDLTTISKGQLVQVIGDQRTSLNELLNRLQHINTLAHVLQERLVLPFSPHLRKHLAKLVTISACAIPETKPQEKNDEAASPSEGH